MKRVQASRSICSRCCNQGGQIGPFVRVVVVVMMVVVTEMMAAAVSLFIFVSISKLLT